MERLTKRLEDGQAVLNCVECEVRGILYCTVIGCRNRLKDRLAAYEDAEEQGLLVRLPCKVGDTVWFYLYKDRVGIRKGIYQGIITELKAVQRLNRDAPLFLAVVRFEHPDPRYSYEKLSTSEMHCSFGEYGSWVQFYLTREEAEAALAKEG